MAKGSGRFSERLGRVRQQYVNAKTPAARARARERASNLNAQRTSVIAALDQAQRVRRMLNSGQLGGFSRAALEDIARRAERDYKRGRRRLGL